MYVCMVTACARRVVTELVSERFPAIKFHSQPVIAAIIIHDYGPCTSRRESRYGDIILRVTPIDIRWYEMDGIYSGMAIRYGDDLPYLPYRGLPSGFVSQQMIGSGR
ncbi:hypothetical protein TIFTF001_035626 [Ficus carica]|uniref:Uncharacterized protein n=1 Tax=Ficus carica TaxID=3494 RepID=A0AA88JAC5_FICCA|nr:hypothetical protein TIFTF001_035626 [Ficus carica]